MRASLLVIMLLASSLLGCPKAVPPHELPRVKLCYQVALGTTFITDGAECPLYEAVDDISWRVAERDNLIGDPRWADLTVTLTKQFVIDCGYHDEFGEWHRGRDAMGCIYMQLGDAYVSMWATWSWHDVLDHELSHYAIYLNGNRELDHLRLDHDFPGREEWPDE